MHDINTLGMALMVEQLHSVSDDDGYRPNVGIVLFNSTGQVLWARRSRHDGWQFPQGGIEQGETVEQAAYRELYEEVGLRPQNVELVGRTRNWLRYDVPGSLRSRSTTFKGAKTGVVPDEDACFRSRDLPGPQRGARI